MNRLFDETLTRERLDEPSLLHGTWVPLADVVETPDGYVVEVELPGLGRDDVVIQAQGDELVVRGDRRPDVASRPESFHRLERRYGPFARGLPLLRGGGPRPHRGPVRRRPAAPLGPEGPPPAGDTGQGGAERSRPGERVESSGHSDSLIVGASEPRRRYPRRWPPAVRTQARCTSPGRHGILQPLRGTHHHLDPGGVRGTNSGRRRSRASRVTSERAGTSRRRSSPEILRADRPQQTKKVERVLVAEAIASARSACRKRAWCSHEDERAFVRRERFQGIEQHPSSLDVLGIRPSSRRHAPPSSAATPRLPWCTTRARQEVRRDLAERRRHQAVLGPGSLEDHRSRRVVGSRTISRRHPPARTSKGPAQHPRDPRRRRSPRRAAPRRCVETPPGSP